MQVLHLPTLPSWLKAPRKWATLKIKSQLWFSVFSALRLQMSLFYCPLTFTLLFEQMALSRSHPIPLSLLVLSPLKVWYVEPAHCFPSMGIPSLFITSERVNNWITHSCQPAARTQFRNPILESASSEHSGTKFLQSVSLRNRFGRFECRKFWGGSLGWTPAGELRKQLWTERRHELPGCCTGNTWSRNGPSPKHWNWVFIPLPGQSLYVGCPWEVGVI